MAQHHKTNTKKLKKKKHNPLIFIGAAVAVALVIVILLTASGFHQQVSDNAKKASYPPSYSDEVVKAYLRRAKEMPSESIDGAVIDKIKERYSGVDGEITSLVSQIIFR